MDKAKRTQHELKLGDVVRLVSGGPAMTVTFFEGCQIVCHWFDGSKLKKGTFFDSMLERVLLDKEGVK